MISVGKSIRHKWLKLVCSFLSDTCPEPWKDKLKTMYEDKKRYPNKTGPANFLILRTCDSHYAEYGQSITKTLQQ